MGVPHSVALWRFFPPPLLKRYLVYYILADLENKVRHLWWPNFLQPNPTLCLSPQQTSAPPRRALGHAMQGFQRPSYRKKRLDIKSNYDDIIMGFYGKAFDNGLQAKAAGSKPILFPANQNLGRSGRYRS